LTSVINVPAIRGGEKSSDQPEDMFQSRNASLQSRNIKWQWLKACTKLNAPYITRWQTWQAGKFIPQCHQHCC